MKRSRSELVRLALSSYLERRNYGEGGSGSGSVSAERLALNDVVEAEAARANSIVYSCANSDPHQCESHFAKLARFAAEAERELEPLLPPLLAHLYLEMLRGGHRAHAKAFLERHRERHRHPLLPELARVGAMADVEREPRLRAFRSCKCELPITARALRRLTDYLKENAHLVLIQVLHTWFHLEVVSEATAIDASDEEHPHPHPLNNGHDEARLCNGHADDADVRELRDAIRGVRSLAPPLKLFSVCGGDARLACATLDAPCDTLYAGMSDSHVHAWALAGTLHGRFRGHADTVHAVKVLDDAAVLVSASHDSTIRAWRLADFSCAAVYRGHNYPVWCLDVAKHGVYVASGSYDRTAKLWSLDRTFPLRIFAGHNMDVNAISFHPNGNYLATGSADKTVRLWCVSTGQQVRLFPGHRGSVHCIAFSPDGKSIASGGEDKRIKIWDIATGACLHDLKGHQNTVTSLEWSSLSDVSSENYRHVSDSGVLLSTGMDGTLRLWDSNFIKHKSSSSECTPTVFNSNCSHLVMSRNCSDWLVAVGADAKKTSPPVIR